MIQVLHRALDVLALLGRAPDQPVGLGEIARATGLNAATCARILRTLANEGYVEQEGRRQGYRLGPMAYALTARGPYRKDLVTCAEPAVRRLAETTGETALVAIIHRHIRYTLCHIGGAQDVQVRMDAVLSSDVYPTATGRLLLAHLPPAELEAFVSARGLPGAADWPEAQTRPGLLSALAKLRTSDTVLANTQREVIGLARPIRAGVRVVAALGLYLPASRFSGSHKATILREMKTAAAATGARLERMHDNRPDHP
jgi:IclR family KDG regulon transcriptional repressor